MMTLFPLVKYQTK